MATREAVKPHLPSSDSGVNPWLIAVVVSLAAFMEVLDTSIANVALPHIAGDLGASSDESTWVLTSYLVSNAIILPVSGWFVGHLWPQAIFHAVHHYFYVEFPALRRGVEPGILACRTHRAGRGRRRVAADGASHPGRHVSAGKTRAGFFAVWRDGHSGTQHRADARRMDYRQLFVALDFLHQPAGWPDRTFPGVSLD